MFQMSFSSSRATVQCLHDVFARFGLPDRIASDNAPTFVSAEFLYFLMQNGVKHVTSAPYHPASYGLAVTKTFKTDMRKMTEGSLNQRLARFHFSYCTTPQSTTGVSSAEL